MAAADWIPSAGNVAAVLALLQSVYLCVAQLGAGPAVVFVLSPVLLLLHQVSKETYYSVKRGLLQCQKRLITVSKETYYSVERDLLQCQKRPNTVSKIPVCCISRRALVLHQDLYAPFC